MTTEAAVATLTPVLEGIIIAPDDPAGLVTVKDRPILDIFTDPSVAPALLAAIRQEAQKGFVPDTTSTKGREAISSRAFKVTKTKTYLDGLGKEEVARLKALPAAVDAGRRILREGLEALKDEIRKPLTDWEARVEAARARMNEISSTPARLATAGSAAIQDEIAKLEATPTDAATWGDFALQVVAVLADTKAALQGMHSKALQAEEDARELERLRKEKAERDRQEREEQLRKEGEERARQALAQSSIPAVAMVPPAMVPMLEKAMDAAGVPPAPTMVDQLMGVTVLTTPSADPNTITFRQNGREVGRIENIGAPAPQPAAGFDADIERRRSINRDAMADIMTAIQSALPPHADAEAISAQVVKAIARGRVRHVAIAY